MTLSPPKVEPVTHAPIPTKRYWVSDTCPDRPVSATSESATVAMTSARMTWVWCSAGSTWMKLATARRRAAPPRSELRSEGTAGSSRPTTRPADRRKEGTSSTAITRNTPGIANRSWAKVVVEGHSHDTLVSSWITPG